MFVETDKSLRTIAKESEFVDHLSLIGKSSELEALLPKINSFCNGVSVPMEGEEGIKDYYVPDGIKLPTKCFDYANALIINYDENKPLDLFSKTLEALIFIPHDEKQSHIDSITQFMKRDKPNLGSYIVPLLIDKVLAQLAVEYKGRFARLSELEIKPEEEQYGRVIEELKQDLSRFLQYANEKLSLNDVYNPKATQISFEQCFPYKNSHEKDYSKLTPDYILTLMKGLDPKEGYPLLPVEKVAEIRQDGVDITNEHRAVYTLIHYFGIPSKITHHGSKEQVNRRIILTFGDSSKPFQLSVEHHDGLAKYRGFYLTWVDIADKLDPQNVLGRGKFKSFLKTV